MRLARAANNAGLGHEQHAVHSQGKPVPADDGQSSRGADRAGLAELQLHGRAQADHVAVAEHGSIAHPLAVDERAVMSLQDIAFAAANQGGMVSGQVAHEGDVGWTVRPRPAQDDAIVKANQVAAHGIDPEQEAALGAVGLGAGQGPGRGGAAFGRRGRAVAVAGCGQPDDAFSLGIAGGGGGWKIAPRPGRQLRSYR